MAAATSKLVSTSARSKFTTRNYIFFKGLVKESKMEKFDNFYVEKIAF